MTLNDSVFDGSNGWKHAAQLALQIVRRACLKAGIATIESIRTFHNLQIDDKKKLMEPIPFVLINATDGGLIIKTLPYRIKQHNFLS